MRKPKRCFILCALILAMMPWNRATAGNPPPNGNQPLRVLFTGHLNPDSHPDSVFGYADAHFNYLPRLIRWGTGEAENDSSRDDAARHDNHVRETTITYPGWEKFSGSVAFTRVNRDTLADIILYMWGSVGDGESRRDTMRGVVLFGQKNIAKDSTIDVAAIGTFQDKPFTAMELRVGEKLVNPKARDISGRQSYERLPVDLDVDEADTNERGAALAGVSRTGVSNMEVVTMGWGGPGAMRIYPNPTGTSVRMEGEAIPPGRYHLEVVSAHGEVSRREEVEVNDSKMLARILDVRRLPSGRYLVRLLRDGALFGSYPFIITR